MVAGGGEADVGVAFLRELQIHAAGRDVDELAVVVVGEVLLVFVHEGFEGFVVFGFYPARGGDVHAFKDAVDVVFGFQPLLDDVELQDAHRAQYQIVSDHGFEELGGAFFAELFQSF